MAELSTFIIVREGRAFAPVTIRSEGLLLGGTHECDLQLNDPSIPLAVAGIKEIAGRFYLLPIEPSPFDQAKRTPIAINGRESTDDAALAAGDVLAIGSYRLLINKQDDALVLTVTYPNPPTAAEASDSAPPGQTGTALA